MKDFIYKYAPLDINTISSLLLESIYFSKVSDFDDPTDAAFTISTGSNATDAEAHSIENTKKLYDFMGEQYSADDSLNKTCCLLEKALKEHIGIFCCSKHRVCQKCTFPELNPLMLSHYSEKHRGIVIEYQHTKPQLLHQVDYKTNEYRHFNYAELLQHFLPQDTLKKLEINSEIIKPLLFKFKNWIYQDEYRIFNVPNKSIPYSDLGLAATRIFFGYKVEEHCINTIEKILSNKKIEFYYLSPPIKNNELKNILIHRKYKKGSRKNCDSTCQY